MRPRLNQKSFDEAKNTLNETLARATSATAKNQQAVFICLTFILIMLLGHPLAAQAQLRNNLEADRRAKRRLQHLRNPLRPIVIATLKTLCPPALSLCKGEPYTNNATPLETIKSIPLTRASDRIGAGRRDLLHRVRNNGHTPPPPRRP